MMSITSLFAFIYSVLLQHQNMQNVEKDFWFYLVYAVSILLVIIVLILTIKYLVKPGEKSENHIKRKILRND